MSMHGWRASDNKILDWRAESSSQLVVHSRAGASRRPQPSILINTIHSVAHYPRTHAHGHHALPLAAELGARIAAAVTVDARRPRSLRALSWQSRSTAAATSRASRAAKRCGRRPTSADRRRRRHWATPGGRCSTRSPPTSQTRPTPRQQQRADVFFRALGDLYPCPTCAGHLREYMEAHPVESATRTALSLWVCRAHNDVRRRQRKEAFYCDMGVLDARRTAGATRRRLLR